MVEKKQINFPRYEHYKDSGIEWIGGIPEHWRLVPNKWIFKESKTRVGKRSREFTLLSLTLRGVIQRDMDNPEGKFPAEFDGYQIVNKGDFVFCHFDVEETPRTVGLSNYHGMITGAYTVYKVEKKYDSKYLYYFYLYADINKNFRFLYRGLRNTIPSDSFNSFKSPIPPLPEQTAIAQFLDHKTAQIDRAIAIKEAQIKLLNERKQIMIQEAVTKGLDPSVPMKDSGIEWIGEIPAHWEILPGLRFFSENKIKNTGMIETQVLSLSYGRIIIKPIEKLTGLVPESFETYQVVFPNYIVIRGTDLQNDKTSLRVGFVEDKGIITSAYLVLQVLGNNNPKYLYLFLYTLDITKAIYKYGSGLRQNLSFDDFKKLPILNIPLEEQNEIVAYIEAYSKQTNLGIDSLKDQIQTLKEYKTTLINEAVTGKIKVY